MAAAVIYMEWCLTPSCCMEDRGGIIGYLLTGHLTGLIETN